jgi:hypothetical protein
MMDRVQKKSTEAIWCRDVIVVGGVDPVRVTFQVHEREVNNKSTAY